MRRIPVDSVSIASVGYDSKKRELQIEFRQSGEIYVYFEVPPEEHKALLAAESKGNYLNRVFKQRNYRYTVVRRARS